MNVNRIVQLGDLGSSHGCQDNICQVDSADSILEHGIRNDLDVINCIKRKKLNKQSLNLLVAL